MITNTNVSPNRISKGGVTLFNVTPIIVPNNINGIKTIAMLKSVADTSLYGCLFFNPIINDVNAPVKIISLDIGMASCVTKFS